MRRYVSPQALEEDLWQEARLAFLVSLPKWTPELCELGAFAVMCAKSACLKYVRDKAFLIRCPSYTHERGEAVDLMAPAPVAEMGEEEREQPEPSHDPSREIVGRLWVKEALARLAGQQREVMRLHLSGMNDTEIGRAMGIKSVVVLYHKRRAIDSLRREYGAGEIDPA